MFTTNLPQAYARQRQQGEADMASILLAIITDLQAFNFRETFTDSFEVGALALNTTVGTEGCCAVCNPLPLSHRPFFDEPALRWLK